MITPYQNPKPQILLLLGIMDVVAGLSAAIVYVLAVVFSIFEPIRCQSLLIAFIAASVPLLPALQKVSDKRIEISDPRR